MTLDNFIKDINRNRKGNPHWFTFVGNIEGKDIRLKAWKTWLQIYDVDGIHYNNLPNGCSVKQFNIDLRKPFEVSQ